MAVARGPVLRCCGASAARITRVRSRGLTCPAASLAAGRPAADGQGRARPAAPPHRPRPKGAPPMSAEQKENLDAILRQGACPAGSDVSEQRRQLRELTSAQPLPPDVTVTAAE